MSELQNPNENFYSLIIKLKSLKNNNKLIIKRTQNPSELRLSQTERLRKRMPALLSQCQWLSVPSGTSADIVLSECYCVKSVNF